MKFTRSINRNKVRVVPDFEIPVPVEENDEACNESLELLDEIKVGKKWVSHGCPRCHGDVFFELDHGEILGNCLQCGFIGYRQAFSLFPEGRN